MHENSVKTLNNVGFVREEVMGECFMHLDRMSLKPTHI